jgi:thioredoxin-related protein
MIYSGKFILKSPIFDRMKIQRSYLLITCFLFLGTGISFSQNPKKGKEEKVEKELSYQDLVWYTRMEKAYEVSKKENKPIFAFFTGSDWCGWCRKLQADVFIKQAFIKWAKENVVLLEVDFPRGKQLDPEQQQHNFSLQQTFRVAGYPTIWLFNMSKADTAKNFTLMPWGQLGYPAGAEPGKEEVKFLRAADSLLAPSRPKTPAKKEGTPKKKK